MCNHYSMGKAKKLKMIRRAIKKANPDVPFEALKPHYRKMKKIILNDKSINPNNGKK